MFHELSCSAGTQSSEVTITWLRFDKCYSSLGVMCYIFNTAKVRTYGGTSPISWATVHCLYNTGSNPSEQQQKKDMSLLRGWTVVRHRCETPAATKPQYSIRTINRCASSDEDQMHLPFMKLLAGVYLAEDRVWKGQGDSKSYMLQRPKPLIMGNCSPEPYAEA